MNLLISVFMAVLCTAMCAEMPLPFTRELVVSSPMMSGSDVTIAQNLLIRDSSVDYGLSCDGVYGDDSAKATFAFQQAHSLTETGVLDSATANLLLELHSNDQYKDTGFTAASMGYLYKLHIPVHYNRSIGRCGLIIVLCASFMLFSLMFPHRNNRHPL